VQELTSWLGDSSPEVARAAVARVVEIQGAAAAEQLRSRLLSADLEIVPDIARALRRIGDGSAVTLAIAGLAEEPYPRRLAAATALAVFADQRAVAPLYRALRDPISGVRRAALATLSGLDASPRTEIECARLLDDGNPHVRVMAVRAVSRTAARPGAILAAVAGDPDRIVRLEVARHLASLPDAEAEALLSDRDLRVREAAVEGAGPAQAGLLARLLVSDPSGHVRRAAATTLGNFGDPRVAEQLVPGIDDPDDLVRAAVLRSVARLVTRQGAIRRFTAELASPRAARRRAAVYALAHLRALDAGPAIVRLADDPDADVKLALIHTANVLQRDPESLIRRLADDADSAVRQSAEVWLLRKPSR
jgi:HEAT repeat protein